MKSKTITKLALLSLATVLLLATKGETTAATALLAMAVVV